MSRVLVIAAHHPLPLWDKQELRTTVIPLPDHSDSQDQSCESISVTILRGFKVQELLYYREAVEDLGYPMAPYRYELELDCCPEDLEYLRAYLSANLSPDSGIELWNLWAGADRDVPLYRYQGSLAHFDIETLEQFLDPVPQRGIIGQCCMTITF